MSEKTRFPLYMSRETEEKLNRRYTEDGSSSKTAFIENAINFYMGYLDVKDAGVFLPVAVSSAIEGRLGVMEDRMAALLFKQTVEMDMVMNVVSAAAEITQTELQALRSRCVKEVRQTNGKISFADALACQGSE